MKKIIAVLFVMILLAGCSKNEELKTFELLSDYQDVIDQLESEDFEYREEVSSGVINANVVVVTEYLEVLDYKLDLVMYFPSEDYGGLGINWLDNEYLTDYIYGFKDISLECLQELDRLCTEMYGETDSSNFDYNELTNSNIKTWESSDYFVRLVSSSGPELFSGSITISISTEQWKNLDEILNHE